jgi:hypothetical protein
MSLGFGILTMPLPTRRRIILVSSMFLHLLLWACLRRLPFTQCLEPLAIMMASIKEHVENCV